MLRDRSADFIAPSLPTMLSRATAAASMCFNRVSKKTAALIVLILVVIILILVAIIVATSVRVAWYAL